MAKSTLIAHLQHPGRPDGVSCCGISRFGIGVFETLAFFKSKKRCSHCERVYSRNNPQLNLGNLKAMVGAVC